MKKQTRKEKAYKVVALGLAFTMLGELIAPTAAYALTGGPSQPEFESFEPAGTSEMVNLFTGDFNYNIPLMTVPGPNGGYPINLAYHAGISMEQEASWVGLGWNINAGEISRGMRGLPDDFNGDKVIKTYSSRPSVTLGIGQSTPPPEVVGFDPGFGNLGYNYQLSYNSYSGLGLSIGTRNLVAAKSLGNAMAFPIDLSYTSDDGIGVSAGFRSFLTKHRMGPSAIGHYSTRQGLYKLGLSLGKARKNSNTALYRQSGGVDFVSNSFIPNYDAPRSGQMINIGLQLGSVSLLDGFTPNPTNVFDATWTSNHFKDESRELAAYGYLHLESADAESNDDVLMDFNREKELPVNRHIPTLAIPIGTFDTYAVKGQGVGGSFRTWRSEVGIFSDPITESNIYGGGALTEFGSTTTITPPWTLSHYGADVNFNSSYTYSGQWKNANHWDKIASLKFKSKADAPTDYLFEPAYFKMAGEMTATETWEMDDIWGDDPARFRLASIFDDNDSQNQAIFSRVENKLIRDAHDNATPKSPAPSSHIAKTRKKRVTGIQSRENEQIADHQNYSQRSKNLYTIDKYPNSTSNGNAAYDYHARPAGQIGEMTVINPDGNRYTYALPVYNNKQVEAVFSVGDYPVNYDPITPYTDDEGSTDNHSGADHYYRKDEIPAYAHSHLLTQITSPDYVDITGDGPSEDDLGYYVKFNYSLMGNSYKWRSPLYNANYDKGFHSYEGDDKGSYVYGEKEVYYLNSIETKTHIAHFILNDVSLGTGTVDTETGIPGERLDGLSANDENAGGIDQFAASSSAKIRYLKAIELYQKNDNYITNSNPQLLKKINFKYDYSLCPNTFNNYNANISLADNTTPSASSGKLTLKEVTFSYLENNKGALSPYKFEYGHNPRFRLNWHDRWGTYKPETPGDNRFKNTENPYTNQKYDYDNDCVLDPVNDAMARNNDASAWNLTKITLPSGADINITYESDDYAYVQDKKATEMVRVVGVSKTNTTSLNNGYLNNVLEKDALRIYFELDKPVVATGQTQTEQEDIVRPYIEGLEQLYFKMYIRLKKKYGSNDEAYDYVNGYCKIDFATGKYGLADAVPTQSGCNTVSTHFYGYLTVVPEEFNSGANDVHPFRKAAWQYMRLQRPDLFKSENIAVNSLANLALAGASMLGELQRMLGFYNFANARGYAKTFDIDIADVFRPCTIKPSYIRLNNPAGKKYGGGCRVSKITTNDQWDAMTGNAESSHTYGQQYQYQLADGTSSGVASYEPLIGGDEIALRKPQRYKSDAHLFSHADLFVEEPYCESLFPAPVVGYSRVVSMPIDYAGVSQNKTGTAVTEFYTAKDFPVITEQTDVQRNSNPVLVGVLGIGNFTINNKGYSQGYKIEFNDMHGRLKSQAVYAASADINNLNVQPTSKTEYIYQTATSTNSLKVNKLSSTVTALYGDGVMATAELGKTYDFNIDMSENLNRTISIGGQANLELYNFSTPTPVLIPSFYPMGEYARSQTRTIVTLKAIYRSGIISEVRTFSDGAMSVAKNLMYDAETGAPLLTQVFNNFDKPVYTYNYAGHWNYSSIGGAYKNIGLQRNTSTDASGFIAFGSPESYFTPGDEVEYNPLTTGASQTYWVDQVDPVNNRIRLVDENGSVASSITGYFTVVRSGNRNQQVVNTGTIVSLSNPVTDRYLPLFNDHNGGGWNNYFAGNTNTFNSGTQITGFYKDCVSGELKDITVSWNSTLNQLQFFKDEEIAENDCEIALQFPDAHSLGGNSFEDYTFTFCNNDYIKAEINGNTYICKFIGNTDCFFPCLDDVLHADATRLKDDWTFDYADIDRLQSTTTVAGLSAFNDYRAGRKGIWRTESNFLYQVDRKQTSTASSKTDIARDGTYKNFVLYNWKNNPEQNKQWSFVSDVTRYSPFGGAIETRDALGIYSASLQGYKHSLTTAAAANCSYFELAFDGFEEYTNRIYDSHGHMNFVDVNTSGLPILSSANAHTGKISMRVDAGSPVKFETTALTTPASNQEFFAPQPGQIYYFSLWVKADAAATALPYVTVLDNTGTTTFNVDMKVAPIEGWRKIEGKITAPANGNLVRLQLFGGSHNAFFDDIRMQPFKSAMTSSVYDPETHWVLAELDNRNFATYYLYDEEGAVIQVKQETEKGIITLSTGRSNIKRQ